MIEFGENEEENKENEPCSNGNEEEEREESSPTELYTNNVTKISSSEKSVWSCCALDLCQFIDDDDDDNVTLPLRNKCVLCKGFCHASCSKYSGQFVQCRLCDKKKERV